MTPGVGVGRSAPRNQSISTEKVSKVKYEFRLTGADNMVFGSRFAGRIPRLIAPGALGIASSQFAPARCEEKKNTFWVEVTGAAGLQMSGSKFKVRTMHSFALL